MDTSEQLRKVLEIHQLSCGAVIGSNGEVLAKAGDFAAFNSAGLVSGLLGPSGSPANTFASVQGIDCVLPQMWAQGEEFAFLERANGWVVVVFGRGRGDAIAQYALSKRVAQTIRAAFTPEGGAD